MNAGKIQLNKLVCRSLLTLCWAYSGLVQAQTCFTSGDMDPHSRSVLEGVAAHYFEFVARGDATTLQQNAIPSLAANFSGIQMALKDNQSDLSGAQAAPGAPFLLQVEGTAPLQRAEFLCGVFGKNGQTADSAEFVIPNLSPGNYGIVTVNVSGPKGPRTVSFVLQQQGTDWKLGGLYIKNPQIAGHDANWFAERARAFKSKGQSRNAWLYYLEARELAVPVPFMYTQLTDRLYDESEAVKPSDLPVGGATADLAAGGKTYKLTTVFALPVGQDLDFVAKYESADVSDTAKAFQENTAVMKALVAKYPELKDAFDAVVVRAVEPSGKDFGSMLPMKDIK